MSTPNKEAKGCVSLLKGLDTLVYQMTYSTEAENLAPLREIIKFLEDFQAAGVKWKEFLVDAESQKYFLNEWLFSITSSLLKFRAYQSAESVELTNRIIELVAEIGIQTFEEDNVRVFEALKNIFDPAKSYYKVHNQDNFSRMPVNCSFPS